MNYPHNIASRILERADLERLIAYWRFKNMRVVFTNGCFDILHAGHVDYLAKAASLGDVLVIGLNTDNSVRRIKGASRPVNNEQARSSILAALRFVTVVVLFDEETPEKLIRVVQPDVLVKGSDYKPEDVVGYDIVKAKGGEVITIDLLEGFSTTALIEKLRNY
jgi:D-glycero-beta-D-manno-heptose 1-phosphate adenylyltransferase